MPRKDASGTVPNRSGTAPELISRCQADKIRTCDPLDPQSHARGSRSSAFVPFVQARRLRYSPSSRPVQPRSDRVAVPVAVVLSRARARHSVPGSSSMCLASHATTRPAPTATAPGRVGPGRWRWSEGCSTDRRGLHRDGPDRADGGHRRPCRRGGASQRQPADLFIRVSEVDPRGRSLDGARASPGWTPQRPTTSSASSSMPWPTASPRAAGSGC